MVRVFPLAFLAILFLAGARHAQAQVDITGTWEISRESPGGTTTTTFTFQPEGGTFTGTARMRMMGRGG